MLGSVSTRARSPSCGAGLVVACAWVGALWATGCGGNVGSDETGGSGARASGGSGGSSSGAASGSGGTPDCTDVACTTQDCLEGERQVLRDGQCCPVCEPVDCSRVSCPAIGCGPDSVPVVRDGQCCPVCEPIDCTLVDCALVDCPPGTHSELLPGDCCPTCVSGPSDSELCESGQQNLVPTLRNNLGSGITECQSDADCTVVDLTSRCGIECGFAVSVAWSSEVVDFAKAYGEDNCSTCPDVDFACPPVIYTAYCVKSSTTGVCTIIR